VTEVFTRHWSVFEAGRTTIASTTDTCGEGPVSPYREMLLELGKQLVIGRLIELFDRCPDHARGGVEEAVLTWWCDVWYCHNGSTIL